VCKSVQNLIFTPAAGKHHVLTLAAGAVAILAVVVPVLQVGHDILFFIRLFITCVPFLKLMLVLGVLRILSLSGD
jgi:hypothetical protein